MDKIFIINKIKFMCCFFFNTKICNIYFQQQNIYFLPWRNSQYYELLMFQNARFVTMIGITSKSKAFPI